MGVIKVPFKSIPIIGSSRESIGFQQYRITTTFNLSDVREHVLTLTNPERIRTPSIWVRALFYTPVIWVFVVISIRAALDSAFHFDPWNGSGKIVVFICSVPPAAYLAYSLATRLAIHSLMYRKAYCDRGTPISRPKVLCVKPEDWSGFSKLLRPGGISYEKSK